MPEDPKDKTGEFLHPIEIGLHYPSRPDITLSGTIANYNVYGPQGYSGTGDNLFGAINVSGPFTSAANSYIDLGSLAPTGSVVVDKTTLEEYRNLEEEVAALRRDMDVQRSALQAAKLSSADKQKKLTELKEKNSLVEEKVRLNHLLSKVNQEAGAALLNSNKFVQEFAANRECDAFVMSVDIRRSTELMLKARRAEEFASFITKLCMGLIESVLGNYGVLDKFTGDGILAFFPKFFSGPDAGYNVLLAADRCHRVFQQIYRDFRPVFNSVLIDAGLGIGVDYGATRLVQMPGGLSIVGPPVVYACRMGGAPAGRTLLNQPAYERISERFSSLCFVRETELEIKHEGLTLAYEVKLNQVAYTPTKPDWCSDPKRLGTRRGEKGSSKPVLK